MASVPPEIRVKHNKLLVELGDLIDVGAQSWTNFIAFLNHAILPGGQLQRVKHQPINVFNLMEERGKLKVGDYVDLKKALEACSMAQALDLVKNAESEITEMMKGQGSTTIGTKRTRAESDRSSSIKKTKTATQGTSAASDASHSNKKSKTETQGTSTAGDDSPSNEKRKTDDADAQIEQTDTTSSTKVVTPSSQPALISQRTPQSIQVVTPTPQPALISQRTPQYISTLPVQQLSVGRSQLTPFVIGSQAGPQFEEGQSGAEGDLESQGQAGKGIDLQSEEQVLEAIRNNDQKLKEMIRNKTIPKQSIMKEAVKQDGYSKGVQLTLREMSKLLRREISQAVGVWCGYRPNDPHTPVFVVTLKNQKCILKKDEIPQTFIDYTIIIQHKYVPNDEERSIVEHYGSKRVKSEDVARLNNCIATHTESLMREHSNLSIIRPCPVKARGYLRKEMEVIEDTCIVLYVPVKGIIPVGEKEFPRVIDGIYTDVREGEFSFFGGHNAMEYHQKLRMGCCITGGVSGTLGGFVDLPGEKVGCLTSAHVVLTNDQIKQYISAEEEVKRSLNDDLAQGNIQIEIHQPRQETGVKPFGRIEAIALDAGNIFSPSVDAAIIQITDDERKPEMGNFPDGDFKNAGFTTEDPMLYASGDILDNIEPRQRGSLIIKFGCTTGITRGYMEWIGESVRPVDVWGDYCFPVMHGQFEVNTYNFAAHGDSGALAFLCSGGNIRNLHAVGMIMGGSSTGCSCFITPIKTVLEKLGLISNRLKVFPPRQLLQQETISQQLIERTSMTEHLTIVEQNVNKNMNERVTKVEQNMIEQLMRVEQNMNKDMNERLTMVEQNLNEKIDHRFNRMEELLQRLSGTQ